MTTERGPIVSPWLATITQRTIFQSGDDTLEFVLKPEIKHDGKVYRVVLNGKAVDWAYETAVAGTVKSKKVAAFYFEKHVGKGV